MHIRTTILSFFLAWSINGANAQGCCSGGSGSPIAGGASTGVLLQDQMELSLSYQLFQSNNFFTEDSESISLFDNLSNNYLFFRTDYGLSKRLTLSLGTGYFINKSLVELDDGRTISSEGFGDLIIFPRFNVYNKSNVVQRTEITLGLGLKLPLGAHDDSYFVTNIPSQGDIYSFAPPTVQTTNGSQDLMLYSFFFKDYSLRKLRFFSTMLYIKKSYNSLGQKFGDYASLGLFAGKTIYKKIGLTAQVKGEWIGKMKAAQGVDLLGLYNIDQSSTGGKKIFFVPQISFTQNSTTFYVTSEIPLYQYLEGTQVGSELQITGGISYRFLAKKQAVEMDLAPVE